MNILSELSNSLLHRREVQAVYQGQGNPGYAHVQKMLAEKLGSGEDVIVVKRLTNPYGSSEFLIEAFVYESSSHKEKFEPKPKAKKGGAS